MVEFVAEWMIWIPIHVYSMLIHVQYTTWSSPCYTWLLVYSIVPLWRGVHFFSVFLGRKITKEDKRNQFAWNRNVAEFRQARLIERNFHKMRDGVDAVRCKAVGGETGVLGAQSCLVH